YYAAFLHARAFIEKTGFTFPSGTFDNIHLKIQYVLAGSDDADIVRGGALLRRLHDRRKQADYVLSNKDIETPVSAQARLSEAEAIITILNQCVTGNAARRKTVYAAVLKTANKLLKNL